MMEKLSDLHLHFSPVQNSLLCNFPEKQVYPQIGNLIPPPPLFFHTLKLINVIVLENTFSFLPLVITSSLFVTVLAWWWSCSGVVLVSRCCNGGCMSSGACLYLFVQWV